jgi:hypothetical protein
MPSSLILAAMYGAGYAASFSAIGLLAARFAINFAVSLIVTRMFGPSNQQAQTNNGVRQQVPPSTTNSVPVVYGNAYLGGVFVDAVLSIDQKTMYYVLAVSQISPNGQFFFTPADTYWADQTVTFDGTDQTKVIKLTDGAGNDNTKVNGNIYINFYKSSASGVITPMFGAPAPSTVMGGTDIAVAQRWPSSGRQMNGLAFVIVKINYNQDAGTTNMQPITFHASHYLNEAGKAKPGDVWYDYITNTKYGCAMDTAIVDTESATALNVYSDQTITFTNNQGDPATQNRYQIDGVLDTGQNTLSNLDDIMLACDSWNQYNAATGKWSVVINKAEAPSFLFNDSNIVGEIRVSAYDLSSSINQIQAQFPNRLNRDQPDYVYIQTPNELLFTNEPVNKYSVTYSMTNSSVQAQYLANRMLEQAREDLIVSFATTYAGIQVNAGDVIQVTNAAYGWTAKLFRVVKVSEASLPDGNLGAALELNEYNAQVYDDKNITEFQPTPNSDLASPNYFSAIVAPTILASRPDAQIPSFDVRVTIPATGRVTSLTLFYTTSSTPTNNDWLLLDFATQSNSQPYTNGASFDFLNQVLPIGTYYFAVIVSNNIGQSAISPKSASFSWSPVTTGSRNVYPTVYQWAATQPANPIGTSVFTWSTGVQVYDNADAWRVTAPTNPGTAGLQLWQALKWLNDTTGAATTTFSWTFGGTLVQSISQNGTAGSTGPRSASGFLYYAYASSSAPAAPTASGFNFTTGAFTTLTAGWSTSFSMPSTNITDTNNNRFWAARYAVSEATFGGTQTVTISSVFNWTNFDGLVTFSNMSSPSGTNPSGGVTFIDGGHIIAETLTVDRIESGTITTQNNNTFGFGAGSVISGISTVGFFQTTRSDTLALAASSSANLAFNSTTVANTVSGAFGNRIGYGIDAVASGNNQTIASFAHPLYGGFIQKRTQGGSASYVQADGNSLGYVKIGFEESSINYAFQAVYGPTGYYAVLGSPYYAIYTNGPVGPFTGSHDGLLDKTYSPTPGDILVDLDVIAKKGVSDTVTTVEPCSADNQIGVIGIFVSTSEQVPTAMSITVSETVPGIDGPITTEVQELNPIYDPIVATHNYVVVNAVGEGQINVCGRGGDIAKGDLIVASSLTGKGMKQADDFVRGYTVAKAREAVTFATPDEVKEIACIYVSG